jgi:hypothetical protein
LSPSEQRPDSIAAENAHNAKRDSSCHADDGERGMPGTLYLDNAARLRNSRSCGCPTHCKFDLVLLTSY